ncbi:GNAT family protein [Gaiella sp.]|uniref:GNAT family N-acetyltransferase n=1 Tax=Gaiella sp. TaxID=2663207 RepID=UPI0032675C64
MITIRPAEPGDAQALVELASTIGREEGSWLLTTEEWRNIADERRYLRAVRRHPDAAVFVAVEDGGPIARLSLSRDVHPASRHVADLGIMVAENHRRRGMGRALLDQAVAWAASAGVQKLELHVFPWNEPAIALYDAYGFQREGVRRGQYLRNGCPVDAILMALWLGEAS